MNSVPAPSSDGRRARLFFALWPDEATAGRLYDWAQALLPTCGGRAMRRDSLHLTLAFLGRTDAARTSELIAALQAWRIEPGVFDLARVGRFGRLHIVWAGPEERGEDAERLAALHRSLWSWLAPLGWQPDLPFRPHVTLLRNAGPAHAARPPEPVRWHYDRVVLAASTNDPSGPRYRILAASPATRAAPAPRRTAAPKCAPPRS